MLTALVASGQQSDSAKTNASRKTTHFRATPFVDTPGAPLLTKASFVIEQGRPGAQQA